ncbi:hypothetical protein Plhal304r1_c062g0149161 [Plasmopara halstedii]
MFGAFQAHDLRYVSKHKGSIRSSTLYNWLANRNARPVLITATHDYGMLSPKARTVYFNTIPCRPALFEPDLCEEIYSKLIDKPYFVQQHFCKRNRLRPPSLRPPARMVSDV